MKIKLNSLERVKCFVELVSPMDATILLHSGKCVVDARSILGILSLNLLEPLDVTVEEGNKEEVYQKIGEFAFA